MAEALLTLALIGLVLGLVANLLFSLNRHTSSLDRKDLQTTATATALVRLERDLKMAVAWTRPAVNDPSVVTTLEFDIPNYPDDALRLPPMLPGQAATPPWQPLANVLRIGYAVQQRELRRQVLIGGTTEEVSLAFQTVGFSAQRTALSEITLSLTIDQSPQPLARLTRVVSLPLPQSWRQP